MSYKKVNCKADLTSQDYNGRTTLHWAAKNSYLPIWEEFLTTENMLVADKDGVTPMHYAALFGSMAQIPASLRVEETLLVQDSNGVTPLHIAAMLGGLNHVPAAILTTGNLLLRDNNNNTPIALARQEGYLNQLLGTDLKGNEIKVCVGPEWWNENSKILDKKQELKYNTNAGVIDIF